MLPLIAALLSGTVLAASERHTIPGHVPEMAAKLQPVGRLDASFKLRLAIGLASRDEPGLDAFIKELCDPASTNYHRYLTPEQFTERFGPTEADYQTLINFAKANSLSVTRTYSNRVILDVEGAVSNIEKTFQVKMLTYQHPTEPRTFFAPDVEPSIALDLAVTHIEGLDNSTRPFPKHVYHAPGERAKGAKEGSAPGGYLWGNDFRDAYVPGTTLTGTGQNIGLLEFESFYPADISNYETAIGMSATSRPQLITVTVDSAATPNSEEDAGIECSGDIEMCVSMAPGLNAIYVFEDGLDVTNPHFDDILESMLTYTNVLQFSCSWGGSTAQDTNSETLWKQMITQGQSFFDASGDAGAFVGAVQFPSDSPSIMQVGGTTMTDGTSSPYPWESEIVWAWDSGPNVSASKAVSSAGGISTYYKIPYWQTNINMTTNLGSTVWRNFPDVSANADNVYLYIEDGTITGGYGGTSFASPLWAALTALMNQQAAACGEAPVGFLNPALYALAMTTNYSSCFHDITSGNNTWKSSKTKFYAEPGFDLCCGLGTPTGTNLINALAPPVLAVATNVQSNLAVFPGQSATFSASFKGTPPFTYQWTRNGVALANGAGIGGANSNILTISPVVSGDAGTYQLFANNGYGNGQSGQAVLTVDSLPQLSSLHVSGTNFIFSYPTVAGASYQLQSTTNLHDATWVSAGSAVAGTGSTVFTTNSLKSSSILFFRLSITP